MSRTVYDSIFNNDRFVRKCEHSHILLICQILKIAHSVLRCSNHQLVRFEKMDIEVSGIGSLMSFDRKVW